MLLARLHARRKPDVYSCAAGVKMVCRWPALPFHAPQGQKFEYLLNTGNLVSRSGLDLSQATGFTVVAEKLNFFRQFWERRGGRGGR